MTMFFLFSFVVLIASFSILIKFFYEKNENKWIFLLGVLVFVLFLYVIYESSDSVQSAIGSPLNFAFYNLMVFMLAFVAFFIKKENESAEKLNESIRNLREKENAEELRKRKDKEIKREKEIKYQAEKKKKQEKALKLKKIEEEKINNKKERLEYVMKKNEQLEINIKLLKKAVNGTDIFNENFMDNKDDLISLIDQTIEQGRAL